VALKKRNVGVNNIIKKMKENWNKRARLNPRKYVALGSWKTKEEFDKSGLIDAKRVLQGINANKNWVVLEVGVGVGRIVKHLANYFKEIYGVDVSDEMVKIAKNKLKKFGNINIFQNNGNDLSIFLNNTFDFVYSVKVFQHIPRKIFLKYLDEIYRVLKPNGLLKFQIFEKTKILNLIPQYWLRNLRHFHLKFCQTPPDNDTWIARSYSREELSSILKKRFDVIKMENPSGQEGDLWILATKIKNG
jgi:ubiquinone/menaquinone biosynthesis C-methylase UbiE